MSDNRCPSCGTYGQYDFKNQFVSDDWLRSNEMREKYEKEKKALDALLRVVNKITDLHREKKKIPKELLEDLTVFQTAAETTTGRTK